MIQIPKDELDDFYKAAKGMTQFPYIKDGVDNAIRMLNKANQWRQAPNTMPVYDRYVEMMIHEDPADNSSKFVKVKGKLLRMSQDATGSQYEIEVECYAPGKTNTHKITIKEFYWKPLSEFSPK